MTLYSVGERQRDGRPLQGIPSVEVDVQFGWRLADVLEAGGHNPYNSFALVTPEIEADLGDGRHTIHAIDLLGIDDRGAIKFQGREHVSWDEFLRAREAGLYQGDPTRLVVYPEGVAGGLSPDGCGTQSNGFSRTATWQ